MQYTIPINYEPLKRDSFGFPIRPATMFTMQAESGGPIIAIPNPDTDSADGLIATLVNSARNGAAIVTAQKIGRDQGKTSMSWNFLTKDEWERMVRFWDKNFFFKFNYYDDVSGTKISRLFYVGDRTRKPFNVDLEGIPIAYVDCVANVVDTGA